MPALFTAAHLRLSLLLAVLGALIALIFTIFSSSGTTSLIFRPLASAFVMFIIGTVLYALLAKKVPEAIDAIDNRHEEGLQSSGDMAMNEGETGASENAEATDYSAAEGGGSSLDSYDSAGSGSSSTASNIPRKTGVQIGKEEIIVNGVKFKNQPEVMAETIKQLMDQDKD